MAKKTRDKWQFGDFQTPAPLANEVVQLLKSHTDLAPELIIEPTCGKGAFVRAALAGFPQAKILGRDINPTYIEETLSSLSPQDRDRVSIEQGDFFQVDWSTAISHSTGPILILGNPPWVTSSELAVLNSSNMPVKSNVNGHRGIEAITGSGNFDISEWMYLQHIEWLAKHQGTIALLCKYSVARKVIRRICLNNQARFSGQIYRIDARRHFSAAVEACLFVLTTREGGTDFEVYESLNAESRSYTIGERDGYLVRDVSQYTAHRMLQGQDPAYRWRSGVKHDCSSVMELEPTGAGFVNGLGEYVELEHDFVYPLLKGSDVGNSRVDQCRKAMIVTQTSVAEDTSVIKSVAPRTWAYLESHANLLNRRRSSIYRGKPPYSIFGVGGYSFKPWKVAISGLHKRLNFCLVGPIDGKPVVFDDTVSFLACQSKREARFIHELLNSKPAQEFYQACIFWDDKRPISSEILRRLSLYAVARKLRCDEDYLRFCRDTSKSSPFQLTLDMSEE